MPQELCSPCPQLSPKVAFEVLLTVAHTAKFVQVRDLGRKNVGSRRVDDCRMGEPPRDEVLLVDANFGRSIRAQAGLTGQTARKPKATLTEPEILDH